MGALHNNGLDSSGALTAPVCTQGRFKFSRRVAPATRMWPGGYSRTAGRMWYKHPCNDATETAVETTLQVTCSVARADHANVGELTAEAR